MAQATGVEGVTTEEPNGHHVPRLVEVQALGVWVQAQAVHAMAVYYAIGVALLHGKGVPYLRRSQASCRPGCGKAGTLNARGR